MSKEELKQMIVGLIADDAKAITYQTMGQYRDMLMENIMAIDVDYKFETKEPRCYVCHEPLVNYGLESPLDGERVCKECYTIDEYKNDNL